ncbi:MAG: RNA polymerase sigma factor [Balneolaceae bacterium]
MLNWFKRRKKETNSYRSNEEWVKSLSEPPDEAAVSDLRRLLIRGLKPALYKYVDRELDQFVEDVAQDALLKILDKIDTFRGESMFISWAIKIAVREGLSELRRKKWKDISINDLASSDPEEEVAEINTELFASGDVKPDRAAHENMLLSKVVHIIDNELSEKQKTAITALMLHGMSVTVVAEQMGIKRNALYKLVHDARLNLKKKLKEEGIDPDEILNHL